MTSRKVFALLSMGISLLAFSACASTASSGITPAAVAQARPVAGLGATGIARGCVDSPRPLAREEGGCARGPIFGARCGTTDDCGSNGGKRGDCSVARQAKTLRAQVPVYGGCNGGGSWNGCGDGEISAGCDSGGGLVWIPGGTACNGGGCNHTPGSWEPVPGSGCNGDCGAPAPDPNGPGGCWEDGSCGIAYSGTPHDGQKCNGSQFEIGSPVEPANQNSGGASYYVDNIVDVWQNGYIVAVIYQVSTPGSTQQYDFIQETNNGVTYGANIGVNFGPVSIGVSGNGYNSVSALQWFFPGQTKLPPGSTANSCWPSSPVAV